jgi:potassium-transporting ATPase KdpC subunit
MLQQLFPALRLMALLTVVTGVIYPGIVTGLCQVLFHDKANGSLVLRNGEVTGSRLLGQAFTRPEYFHPRPSAAGSSGYDATSSGGSNLGPTSAKLMDRVKADVAQFRKENPDYQGPVPADAVTASGSGLDPDISPENAHAQCTRVAAARHADPAQIEALVRQTTSSRDLGFLGDLRVNVLELNLALDRSFPKR